MTTAVSVPITILWLQAKSLRWILGMFLLLIPVYLFSPNQPGMYKLLIEGHIELLQSGLLNPFIILAVLVGVSSAQLFGFEFSDGALGFIETRPVSHRQLFFLKTGLLVLICAALGILTKIVCRIPSGIHIEFILAALYLDIAFWIATWTLLYRETVRGLLYGSLTLLLVALAVTHLFLVYSMDPTFVVGERTPRLQDNMVALPVGLIGILISPVVVLGLLSVAAHRWRFGNWRITPISIVSILAIASFCSLAHYSFAQEGRTVVPNGIQSSQPNAFHETEDRFYFLEHSRSQDKTRHTIRINKIDWTDPGSGIQNVLEVPLEFDHRDLPEAAQAILSKATFETHSPHYVNHLWMNHNRVLIGSYIETQRSFLYSWNEQGKFDLLEVYDIGDPVYITVEMNDNRLNLIELKDWEIRKDQKEALMGFNLVDLDSGEIRTEVGEIPFIREGEYQDALWKAFDLEEYQPSRILHRNPAYRARVNYMPKRRIQVYHDSSPAGSRPIKTVDVDWTGTFAEGPGHVALYDVDRRYNDRGRIPEGESLTVIDFDRPEEPVRTDIPFPTPRRRFIGDLAWFRTKLVGPERDFQDSNTRHFQHILTLGESHLLFFDNNFHRVYVWNINRPNPPSFIGSAPFPKEVEFQYMTSPVLAPDGTLGLFTRSHGPMWLEFPALMKEAKKS